MSSKPVTENHALVTGSGQIRPELFHIRIDIGSSGNLKILHRPEVSCRDPADREIVGRLQQPPRAQQFAHMVGAERRASPA